MSDHDLREGLRDILARIAPGTALRDALERIVQQGNGALVVLGAGPEVEAITTGGFRLDDAAFSPAKLAELAKMDGGIILDDDASHILRANAHLLPDASVTTVETGARFRTAERVAKGTSKPVLAVSEERNVVTVFFGDEKRELQSPAQLLGRINQDLQTLERFRRQVNEVEERLTRLEVQDQVTLRDAIYVLQRTELVRRIGHQVEGAAVGLGAEGGLVDLQHADLVFGVEQLRDLVARDYVRGGKRGVATALKALESLPRSDLYEPKRLCAVLGLDDPNTFARPLGYRLVSGVPRLPDTVQEELVRHFRDIQKLMLASVADLNAVSGVGEARALGLRRYFDRLQHQVALSDIPDL